MNDIKQRLSNGFKPFPILLSDGRRFVVPQRDFIAFSPNKVVILDENEVSHIINVLHIVSIDDADAVGQS